MAPYRSPLAHPIVEMVLERILTNFGQSLSDVFPVIVLVCFFGIFNVSHR